MSLSTIIVAIDAKLWDGAGQGSDRDDGRQHDAHAIPKSASADGFRPFPRSHRVEAPMRGPQDDGSRVERNRSLRPGKAGRKVHAVACYAPSAAGRRGCVQAVEGVRPVTPGPRAIRGAKA